MSRFLKIMIVLLTIAAVATPVLAEDRLSLSGEMRVRGWHVDMGDAATNDATKTWADQRLRVAGKLSVAEGVAVNFRFDATEANWGDNAGFGSGRTPASGMQWDRAHLDITKNNWALRAGQQWIAFGKSGFDAQDNGLLFTLKSAVPVSVFFMVDDYDRNGEYRSSDDFFFGAQASHKTDSYSSNLYFAGQKGDVEAVAAKAGTARAEATDPVPARPGEEVYVIGLNYATSFDALNLFAEFNYFTGDASETQDAFGTQLFVDASMAATDTMTVGAQLFYALGDEEDKQYVVLGNDFGGWDPLFAIGTGLDNEQIGLGRPFDAFEENAGIIAGRLYTSVKATDSLNLSGSFTYATAEEDANLGDTDTFWALAVGTSYQVMANTKLGAQIEYIDPNGDAEEVMQGGVGLFVSF